MFASNNILSALINSDAVSMAEGATKNLMALVTQQGGLFQEVLQGEARPLRTGKGETMQTLLDQNEQGQKEVVVSTQELLSALSLLSIVGVIPTPIEDQTPWTLAPVLEPSDKAISFSSNQEKAIQAILNNASPSYVTQIEPTNPAMAESDLDALISSIILSKNKQSAGADTTLADLGWTHFNEAVLTGADQTDTKLAGFTFTEEMEKPVVSAKLETPIMTEETAKVSEKLETPTKPVVSAKLETPIMTEETAKISEKLETPTKPVVSPKLEATTLKGPLTEPFLMNGLNKENGIFKEKENAITPIKLAEVMGIKEDATQISAVNGPKDLKLDLSSFGQPQGFQLQKLDAVEPKSYTPEWRPNSQIEEYAVIKQVAEKLSLHRFDSKGSEGITLELEPKGLGSLKIEISVHKNMVSADILTQHATVRDILDKNQTLLRDAMAGMGFVVDHFSVNVGDFSHFQNNFTNKEQFNHDSGTKYASSIATGSEDSEFVTAGRDASYWGYKESEISVYV